MFLARGDGIIKGELLPKGLLGPKCTAMHTKYSWNFETHTYT